MCWLPLGGSTYGSSGNQTLYFYWNHCSVYLKEGIFFSLHKYSLILFFLAPWTQDSGNSWVPLKKKKKIHEGKHSKWFRWLFQENPLTVTFSRERDSMRWRQMICCCDPWWEQPRPTIEGQEEWIFLHHPSPMKQMNVSVDSSGLRQLDCLQLSFLTTESLVIAGRTDNKWSLS